MSLSRKSRDTLQPELQRHVRQEPEADAHQRVCPGSTVAVRQRRRYGVRGGLEGKYILHYALFAINKYSPSHNVVLLPAHVLVRE